VSVQAPVVAIDSENVVVFPEMEGGAAFVAPQVELIDTVGAPGLVFTTTGNATLTAALVGADVIVSVFAAKLAVTLTLAFTLVSVRGFAMEPSLQLANV
jgi:hypothetical protein